MISLTPVKEKHVVGKVTVLRCLRADFSSFGEGMKRNLLFHGVSDT